MVAKQKILIVDDDNNIAELIFHSLVRYREISSAILSMMTTILQS